MVNIITQKYDDNQWHGSWNAYYNVPEHKEEGATRRTNFSLEGPLGDDVSFRLYGNLAKTQADAYDINEGHAADRTGTYAGSYPAGREGVIKDINAMLRWAFAPMQFLAGYSRQGNLLCRRHAEHQHQRAGEKPVWQRDQPPLSPELLGEVDRRLG
nr:Ferric enterobactin esterase [Candidatus Pantoea persica]